MGNPSKSYTVLMADDDVRFSYDVGVNSCVTKPVTFRAPVNMISTLTKYWFELVELPPVQ